MILLTLVSHEGFAEGLLKSSAMILGNEMVKDVQTIELDGLTGIDAFSHRLKSWLKTCTDVDGVLILADLFGGSPCNTALAVSAELEGGPPIGVVGGVNLGMLIEVLLQRSSAESLEQLIEVAKNAGIKSVVVAREQQKNIGS